MLIYVDAFNFGHKWFKANMIHFNTVSGLKRNVQNFCDAFRNSGHTIVPFLDATRQSEEAVQKYQSRIEAACAMDQLSSVPDCFGEFIANAFLAAGIEDVRFSMGVDNDDLLAYCAQKDGAAILSADQDFFRYRGSSFTVYSDYEIKKGMVLSLTPAIQNMNRVSEIEIRDFIEPHQAIWKPKMGLFVDLELDNFIRCGTFTPLIKSLMNPMFATRPLRQAMYARLGKDSAIIEIIPYWNNEKEILAWTNDSVYPDSAYDRYLENPFDALAFFFPGFDIKTPMAGCSEKDWANHCMGVYTSIFSIYSRITGVTLMSLFQPFASHFAEPLVHSFSCSLCKKEAGLTKGHLEFFQKNNLSIPGKCQECLDLKRRTVPTQNNKTSGTVIVCIGCGMRESYQERYLESFDKRGLVRPKRCRSCLEKNRRLARSWI